MVEKSDNFNDIRNKEEGIFAADQAAIGPGLQSYNAVASHVTEEGLLLEFTCAGCGGGKQLLAEWAELVAMKYWVNPAIAFRGTTGLVSELCGWVFMKDEKAWRPHMRCNQADNFWFAIRLKQHEIQSALNQGKQNGSLDPQQENRIGQHCAAIAQRMQQQPH